MRLHLGCGKRYIPGFVHVDGLSYPHVDYVQPIDRLDGFATGTVDLIYACHVVEHFKRSEVLGVLQEWFRVIRPGGIIRLSVPNFDALAKIYLDSGDIDLVVGPICGRQDHQYNVHYNIFDIRSMTRLLEQAGFVNVRLYDWRATEHAAIDDFAQAYIPHMDKENGRLISLNVEATKP